MKEIDVDKDQVMQFKQNMDKQIQDRKLKSVQFHKSIKVILS